MSLWHRRLWSCFALYLGLTLLLTWPLATHFTTHVAGDGIDDPSLAWNLWWIKDRLVDQRNLDIFHVDWLFYPITINLGFYTLTPLNGLLSVPLQSALNLIIATNLLLLSSFVLGGVGVYLLATQELAFLAGISRSNDSLANVRRNSFYAALFAGVVYAFTSSKLFYAGLGQFNIASTQWIPFCLLYLLRLARSTHHQEGLRNALLAGLFLTMQAWAELTYASFLLLLIGILFLWTVRWRMIGRQLSWFLLLGFLFLLGITPFLWAMIPDLLEEGDFFASGGGFADLYSADLLGYFLPTQRHPWLGNWVDQFPFPHDKGQQIYIGYSATLLALVGAIRWLSGKKYRAQIRWTSFWIVMTFFFWWLTLGSQVRWNGNALPIPGPFALISQLPFFSGNRYPSRYSVMLMLTIAILAAAGLYTMLTRVSLSRVSLSRVSLSRVSLSRLYPWLATSLLLIIFLFEHLSIPVPLNNFQVPALYERLATAPGEFTLLELPTGWRNGARVLGKSDILIMMQQWYQTTHGKRRLGGNTSRNPLYKFQYFTEAPLLGDLIALMNALPSEDANQNELFRVVDGSFAELAERNRAVAPSVLDFLDVRYLTLHEQKTPPLLQRFVTEVLPVTLIDQWEGTDWSGAPATIDLFAVQSQPEQQHWSLDLADPESTLYLAEGWAALPWQGVRYSTRPCATLLLDLPAVAGQLTINLAEAHGVNHIVLNDTSLVSAPGITPATLTITFDAEQATASIDRLTLCAAAAHLANSLRTPPTAQGWPIGETGAVVNADLFVRSAGNEVGNFAQILRNGEAVMATARGYNLAAFDQAGQLLTTATFDTHLDGGANDALAHWIEPLPLGTVVAGAVMDEGSNTLTEQAIQALQTLGVETDLRGRFRWSHAFIGVKGAAPGHALESSALLHPAMVTLGVAVDGPVVYLGIRSVDYQVRE